MTGRSAAVLAAVLLGIAGAAATAGEQPLDVDWRRLATPADRTRLRQWRQAWVEATATARALPGGAAALAGDPMLFDPDHALTGAALPVGGYRCRTIRIGPRDAAMKPVAAGGWAPCALAGEGGAERFSTGGAQRIEGHVFADTDARSVFLGTLVLGDESRAMRYGRDRRRDVAGVLERIGERRWRLVLPYPAFATTLDLVEIAG